MFDCLAVIGTLLASTVGCKASAAEADKSNTQRRGTGRRGEAMKLSEIHDKMHDYNNKVAYGSECNAWGDFVNDSYEQYGVGPWDDRADQIIVSRRFADYWLDVSRMGNADYDKMGNRLDN